VAVAGRRGDRDGERRPAVRHRRGQRVAVPGRVRTHRTNRKKVPGPARPGGRDWSVAPSGRQPKRRGDVVARSIYIASPEGRTGKSTIALGLVDLFVRRVERVGIFRPVVPAGEEPDNVLELLLSHDGVDQPYEDAVGVTYDDVHADENAALSRIVERFHAVEQRSDIVVIVGSD